jgi:tetratricopeptide (TPR) repeat protein
VAPSTRIAVNLTPEQLDETAAALLSKGKFHEYLEITEMLVRDHPSRADVHLHRARALAFGADRRDEALHEIDAAERLAGDDPRNLMRIGALLLAIDETNRVDGYVDRAVKAAGLGSARDDPNLAYLAGMAASARGDDDAALALLEVAVAGHPREPDYARDLARTYIRVGHTERARAVAARARESNPGDERLERLANPVPAEAHAEAWNRAVERALDGNAAGIHCPVYGDGELVWKPIASPAASEQRYRMHCPMCGAEVEVNVQTRNGA